MADFRELFRVFPLDGSPVHIEVLASSLSCSEKQARNLVDRFRASAEHGRGKSGWLISDGQGTKKFYRTSVKPGGVGPGDWKYPHSRHIADADT